MKTNLVLDTFIYVGADRDRYDTSKERCMRSIKYRESLCLLASSFIAFPSVISSTYGLCLRQLRENTQLHSLPV